jgi:flagellin
MSVINTNISALQAQNSLRTSSLNMSAAMERLSSGTRINSAKDDAAGLAISTRMTASIRGISAAIRNANDGISLTQTAEGSLNQISDNLQRVRELAVQSANTGNSASDRAAMNNESKQLIAEIDRVASNTVFNGIKLLDGSFQNQALQVGASNSTNDRINISIGSAKSNALGANSAYTSYSATVSSAASGVSSTALASGDLSINGFQVGASVSDGVSSSNATSSAIAKANAINAVSGDTGVTATANITTLAATAVTSGSTTVIVAGDVKINGIDLGAISSGVDATGRGSQLVAAINSKTSQTGVTATLGASGAFTMNAADGRNIQVALTANGGTATNGALSAATTTAGLTLTSTGSAGITVAAIAAGATAINITAGTTAATPAIATSGSVSGIDLTSAGGSQAALTTLDSAIDTITNSRASMGAYQNRLTASVSNLETTSMNLSASRSRILDTDYAKETTSLAKSQIISQAATAMLAQANQSGQSVLALLK